MKAPSHHERLQIWRYTYARQSFFEAMTAAKLLNTDMTLSPTIKSALTCQVIVAYARPFTKSQLTQEKRQPLVPAGAVPVLLKERHQSLLDMRDQVIGHKDATAFPDAAFNKVLVKSYPGSVEIHTVPVGGIEPTAARETICLCRGLIFYCEQALAPFSRAYLLGVHQPPAGLYVLSTSENPDSWLTRLV